jgi:uncharacterized oligopeptide transporter (OPT) family protein
MPAIKFFGHGLATPIYPGIVPVDQMSPAELWSTYIRPMGAGAVAAAGLITLVKTIPTIVSALTSGMKQVRKERGMTAGGKRTERDLPIKFLVFGSIGIVVLMWLMLTFRPIPGAQTGLGQNLLAAFIVVTFGFLFVTVASRISGLIGNSSNPVSGMTIATLMATCAVFLMAGWKQPPYAVLAITIGGVVCIASAIAGATSQDLKTGFLVGATPVWQQIGLIIGVTISTIAVGGTLILMNKGLAKYNPVDIPLNIQQLPTGVAVETQDFTYQGKTYVLVNSIGSSSVPDGKYLYDASAQKITVQWVQGIGSEQAAAPQARLMATVINGILNQRLPWRLVLLGVFLVIAVELLGIRSLPFAVGSYLSIATTMAIFAGGVVRWLAERGRDKPSATESEVSPGSLYSSGLIAAGGVFGLLAIIFKVMEDAHWMPKDLFLFGPKILGSFAASSWLGVIMFVSLAASLYFFARKKLE